MISIKNIPEFDSITHKPEPDINWDIPLISFSQLQTYHACPNKWKLRYIDKLRLETYNIHLLYGTAMHQVIQMYIHYIFNVSVKQADNLDLHGLLLHYMTELYLTNKNDETVTMNITRAEMDEFYDDGIKCIDWIKSNRTKYFSTKKYKLFAIEYPIYTILDDYGVGILQKLDIVLQDKQTNEYLIIDLKTAKQSWKDYKKKDDILRTQLILYKIFFGNNMNISIDKIKTVFYVLKRKVLDPEQFDFPMKVSYIQKVDVPNGNITMNKSKNLISESLFPFFNLAIISSSVSDINSFLRF